MNDATAWNWFSKFIRARDVVTADGHAKCFTCGALVHWKKGDCGHGVPRQHKATKFHEQNNHFQCTTCNWLEGGKREVYERKVDERYGKGTWNKLLALSRTTYKRTQFDLDVMSKYYRQEFNKLKKEKNL